MSDRPQYSYSPLPSGQIRILQVTQGDDQILCSLNTVSLSNHPKFRALSYCWGSESPTLEIICDGAALKVTPYLFEGLRCIFGSLGSTMLWIDAICINQADNAEKTSQVALMWNIYTTATEVVVWLGLSQGESDLAFEVIPQLCLDFAKIPDGAVNVRNLDTFGLPPINDPVWLALEYLYRRPWFQRLWIVQEAILAQELYVICGTKQLQWGQLCAVSEAILKNSLHMRWRAVAVKECLSAMRVIGYMNGVRDSLQTGYVPAAVLLQISRNQATKDPIDRVFGILGLFKPEIRQSIQVDYSTESRAQYWRAYVQLVRCLLVEEGPKLLIVLDSKLKNPELPSWCPDLNQTGGTSHIPYVGYSAGGRPSQYGLTVKGITVRADSDEVQIPGINADTVIDTAELTNLDYWDRMPAGIPKYFSHMSSADMRGRELLERLRPRFDISISQYARALVANQDWKKKCEYSHSEIEADYEAAFQEMRSYAAAGRRPFGQAPARKSPYLSSLPSICDGRNLFATEKGRIGVGPRAMRPGDHVCVFFSGYCPWILRRELGTSAYRILGDAYVEGLMNSEIYDLFDIDKDGYETFDIV